MPIYKAKTTCFVGKVVRHKGESFEYNGSQNDHLELVKENATTHSPPKATPETTVSDDHLEPVAGSESAHSPPKAMPETTMPEAVLETKLGVEQEIVDTKQDLEQSKRPSKPQANKA